MDRSEVKQHVLDALGKILVDKSLIQENDNTPLRQLVLSEEDFAEFFANLQADSNIALPSRIKSEIAHSADHHGTLQSLVDLILVEMKTPSRR